MQVKGDLAFARRAGAHHTAGHRAVNALPLTRQMDVGAHRAVDAPPALVWPGHVQLSQRLNAEAEPNSLAILSSSYSGLMGAG